ncbi:MAG: hypothetical protein ACPL6C_02425 [bacterium]
MFVKDLHRERDTDFKRKLDVLFRKGEFELDDKEKILKWFEYFERRFKGEDAG